MEPVSFGRFTSEFVDALAQRAGARRVLEVFAGNGLLAGMLAARGVDIRATSLFASHDGHSSRMCHPVEELEASAAVLKHGDWADILLMSWPTATEAAADALLAWGDTKPVWFIGERTRPGGGIGGLGGCATDRFFAMTDVVCDLPGYSPRNRLDGAVELKLSADVTRRFPRGFMFDHDVKTN